jgi:serine/threonine-protein kinase
MGRVYEVEHVELGKRFVLKSLQPELSRRHDLVARLRNEWRALARLEHPNIVNVTDAGTSDNGVPFYVMERLEGETLGGLLHRERRLPPPHALAIAAGILDGLHAAHQIGVVHRDVKPPNVFLTAGAVKILDFGIAKIKDAKDVITARGIAVGTPRYMSPEQARGTAVDARSDIYATGLMLFEMVSGVGPFDDAQDHNQLLLAHLGRRAPLLSSVSVVSPELDAVVAGMLAKDPRERPPSAQVVADTLRDLSLRYAHFVGTQSPTVGGETPRPAASLEPPTRVEGMQRRSRSASASASATRPDGVAANSRAETNAEGDTTTLQPAIERATTAAHVLPHWGATQRLPDVAPLSPPSFYGPDTLVEPLTQAPTAVPDAAPEHTEMLLAIPLAPGARAPTDPGPTRTSVPVGDVPNSTPPPVVPNLPATPLKAGPKRTTAWALAATAAALLVAASVLALRGAGHPDRAVRPVAAAAPVAVEPVEPVEPAAAPESAAAPQPAAEPPARPDAPAVVDPSAEAAAAPPVVTEPTTNTEPTTSGVILRNLSGKLSRVNAPLKARPPAAAQLHKGLTRAKAGADMPGSGL